MPYRNRHFRMLTERHREREAEKAARERAARELARISVVSRFPPNLKDGDQKNIVGPDQDPDDGKYCKAYHSKIIVFN